MSSTDTPDPRPLTRRDFAKTALAATVVAPLAACAAGPDTAPSPAPDAPGAPPTTGGAPAAPSGPPQPQGEKQPDPVAEALLDVIRARYGDRLNAEQLASVRAGIEGNLQVAKALHDFQLPITTEPAFVFRAYRGGAR